MCRRAAPITVDPTKLATLMSMHSNHSPEGQTTPQMPEVTPIYDEADIVMDDYEEEEAPVGDTRLAADLTKLLQPIGGRRRTLQLVAVPKKRSHKKQLH